MNLKLELEFSKADILKDIDALKKQIDGMRPLPEDVEGRVMQKLRLDWNYNSNAIEGNKLSYGETVALIMEGITANGKPLKDSLDIRGHDTAIDFLLSIIKDNRPFSEADIRALHQMVLVEPYTVKAKTPDGLTTTKRIALGEYKTSPNHVETATGQIHYYATPEETPAKMQELMEWYNTTANDKFVHPVVVAALFHHKFVEIHPFSDGNGRLSRILMNLILMQNDYPPVVIKMDDRINYYSLLSRADNNDSWPFVEYIVGRLSSSLQLYLKAATGGDIDEEEDIDKEIALFKMELKNETKIKEEKSDKVVLKIIKNDIYNLFSNITDKANEFDEFFFDNEKHLGFGSQNGNINPNWEIYLTLPIDENLAVKSEYVNYICIFKEFKNVDSLLNLSITWKVDFTKYHYTITDSSNREVLNKYYNQTISKKEQQILIKHFIDELKLSIKSIL